MTSPFEKYNFYKRNKKGQITGINEISFEKADEAFELFKELFDCNYGSIYEDDNLIEIHTGGWSENEALIEQLKQTIWWLRNHKITKSGGHYYFDTDFHSDRKWVITKEGFSI